MIMEAQKIIALLNEASQLTIGKDFKRINEIQCLLGHETIDFDKAEGVYRSPAETNTILDTLFIEVLDGAPHLLPSLAPLFLLICGDREEGMRFSDIDFTALKQLKP